MNELVNTLGVFKHYCQDNHTTYCFEDNEYLSKYYGVAYPEEIKNSIKDVLKKGEFMEYIVYESISNYRTDKEKFQK